MNGGKITSLALPLRIGEVPPSIALIDPSQFRRTCVSATLSSYGFDIIDKFTSADMVDGERYDLVIFFTEMAQIVNCRLQEQIDRMLTRSPLSKIIVLLDDPGEFVRQNEIFSKMTTAVLHENIEPEVLRVLLHVAHLGYSVIPAIRHDRVTQAKLGAFESGAALENSHPLLGRATPRQREVLAALFAGYSNKQIAKHLSISESTVKTHVYYLMRLLGASNRTQIVLKLARSGTGTLEERAARA